MARIKKPEDNAVIMVAAVSATPSIHDLEIEDRSSISSMQAPPQVTFTPVKPASPHKPSRSEDSGVIEPLDPDPFLGVDMDSIRMRAGRRPSWAPQPGSTPPETGESSPG